MGERIRGFLRAAGAVLLDPPGWIPAWFLTGALVYFLLAVVKSDPASAPVKMDAARLLADVYKAVLAIWLSYKGVGIIGAILKAWRGKID